MAESNAVGGLVIIAVLVALLVLVLALVLRSRRAQRAAAQRAAADPRVSQTACQVCGDEAPTKVLRFRRHTGMLVMMQWGSATGRMCRSCAPLVYRREQRHTAIFGWWGLMSLVITPIVLILNASQARKIAGIPAARVVPARPAPAVPALVRPGPPRPIAQAPRPAPARPVQPLPPRPAQPPARRP